MARFCAQTSVIDKPHIILVSQVLTSKYDTAKAFTLTLTETLSLSFRLKLMLPSNGISIVMYAAVVTVTEADADRTPLKSGAGPAKIVAPCTERKQPEANITKTAFRVSREMIRIDSP